MRRASLILFICLIQIGKGQDLPAQLKQFDENILLDRNDTRCINISGEWLGEEIQYDPTQSYIKVKFKVEFSLKQEGNIVIGTTYIRDKFRGSYGYMKIRGVIVANKFHFEEYEVLNEKFFEKNIVWCLRAGVLSIEKREDKYYLDGLDYNGYTSTKYEKCTDYVKMSLSCNLKGNVKEIPVDETIVLMNIFPNPTTSFVSLKYKLVAKSNVKIDIFDLLGKHINQTEIEEKMAGEYTTQVDLTNAIPGVYLLRFMSNSNISTYQIIKTE